jgi:hypothetical protein
LPALQDTVGILPGNEHGLAAPGMKRVLNPSLDRVSAGSMSCFEQNLDDPDIGLA